MRWVVTWGLPKSSPPSSSPFRSTRASIPSRSLATSTPSGTLLPAASAYKSLQSGAAMLQVFGLAEILIGCVVAAVTAALAVRFFVTFLTRHGLFAFAIYRILLAAVLTAWLVWG